MESKEVYKEVYISIYCFTYIYMKIYLYHKRFEKTFLVIKYQLGEEEMQLNTTKQLTDGTSHSGEEQFEDSREMWN